MFGGYDLSFNPSAMTAGKEIRDRWIMFVNGKSPWDKEKRFAFGPHGNCGEIDDGEFAARRRMRHFEILRDMDWTSLLTILGKLTGGKDKSSEINQRPGVGINHGHTCPFFVPSVFESRPILHLFYDYSSISSNRWKGVGLLGLCFKCNDFIISACKV